MAKLLFWDKQSDLLFPQGFKTARQCLSENPWMEHGKTVLEIVRGVTVGIHSFGVLCGNYDVPEDLDDDAALAYIEAQIAEQRRQAEEAAQQPTAEERIAAAMEFQNLTSI